MIKLNKLNKLSLKTTEAKFANQYKGLELKFSGRLRGAQRAKSLKISYGKKPPLFLRKKEGALSQKQILSKWGTIGSTVLISRWG